MTDTRLQRLRAAARSLAVERSHPASDLVAVFTFAVVNVPQAMGTRCSVFMNVSTTGALAVAAGVVLVDLPAGQRAEALVVLVLLVGAIQLLAGVFRLGFLIRFVSNAVMTGFLNGVAVLIILGQLSDLTGYRSGFSNRVAQALDLLLRIGRIDLRTTLVGGFALALIVVLLWIKALQRFAFIIAIAAATVLLVVLTLAACLPCPLPPISARSPRSAASRPSRASCLKC
jgi:SulP family sulfate permease